MLTGLSLVKRNDAPAKNVTDVQRWEMQPERNFEERLLALRAYIRYVMEQKGWTAFKLGRESGLAGRTITRYIFQEPPPNHLMSLRSLNKIAHATGLPPGPDVVSALNEEPLQTDPDIMLAALQEARRQLSGLDGLDAPTSARTLCNIYDDLVGAVREGIELDAARRYLRRRFDRAYREEQARRRR